MRRHTCPRCGAPISYWRYQRGQSGRLRSLNGSLECPQCGTALRWSVGQSRRFQTAVVILGIALIAWFYFSESPRGQRQWIILAFCLGAGIARIGMELLTVRLVEVEDD